MGSTSSASRQSSPEGGSTPWTVILVSSTSHALRAEKMLAAAGIACKLIPVPRRLSSDCGVCVRIGRAEREPAAAALAARGLAIEGIHDI